MVLVELSKTSRRTTGRGRERGLLRHQLQIPRSPVKLHRNSYFYLLLLDSGVEKQAAGHGKRGKGRIAGHAASW